jgi:hypothetical protein
MVGIEALFGEASEVDPDAVDGLDRFLIDDESVERVFVVVNTSFVFSSERLLVVQREGFTGRRMDFHTVPYESIRDFTLGTPGRFESESELRIWLYGMTSPIRHTVDERLDADIMYRALSERVLQRG